MKRLCSGLLSLAIMLAVAPLAAHADNHVPPAVAKPAEAAHTAPSDQNVAGHDHKMAGHDWHKMTPEEREKKHEMHKAMMEKKIAKLPPEKQAEMRAKMEQHHAERQAMHEKMKGMTPEQRHEMMEKWRADHKHPMLHHDDKPPAILAPATPTPAMIAPAAQ
jgi:hypothetical protein